MQQSYRELCKSQTFGKTAQQMFPASRHRRFWKVIHPLKNVIEVSTDRSRWQCMTCVPTHCVDMSEKQDESSRNSWHWGNCKKHFLSEQHWSQIVSRSNTTGTLKAAADQHSTETVAKQELVTAIVNDTIVEMRTKSLTHLHSYIYTFTR